MSDLYQALNISEERFSQLKRRFQRLMTDVLKGDMSEYDLLLNMLELAETKEESFFLGGVFIALKTYIETGASLTDVVRHYLMSKINPNNDNSIGYT